MSRVSHAPSARAHWPWLVVAALAIAGAFRHVILASWVRRDHVVGIDVSHHQGRIDWGNVRATNTAFAFIKATEGATLTDPAFATNWTEAGAAGVLRGAYHFFTFCAPGREQAAHFVEIAPPESGTLPPLVDLEIEGNCARRPSPDELKAQVDDFLGVVETAYRRKVIFYVTEDTYATYGMVTQGHELFVREPWLEPRWLGDRRWLFWQFDDGGRVDGVEGAVDRDAFRGGSEGLRALAHPR